MGYWNDRDYVICTSTTRPTGWDGRMIYETDTNKNLVWHGELADWYPPWNTSWGRIASSEVTGTAFDSLTPTQLTISNLTYLAGRLIRFSFAFRARTATAGTLVNCALGVDFGSGTFTTVRNVHNTFAISTGASMSETWMYEEDSNITTTTTVGQVRLITERITGTASTTTPNMVILRVDDIGPT